MGAESTYLLPEIPYLTLHFQLVAQEDAVLPDFKGSLLHGAFGNALRRAVCVMGPKQPCADCLLNRQCINTQLFETFIFEEPPRFLRGITTAPKPFVLDCADQRSRYHPGEVLAFTITLFGKATVFYSYCIFAVEQLGRRGLGRGRAKFHLQNAAFATAAGDWQPLYSGESQALLTTPPPLSLPAVLESAPVDRATLLFLTPLRLRVNGEYSRDFSFRELLFRMLRRILEMAHFYVPEKPVDWEFHDFLVAAERITVSRRQLYWVDLNRYSGRQKQEMNFGGYIGQANLEGPLNGFGAILQAAEILHIGKGTTFGLGKMRIEYAP